ncbi:MAG: hypothetical protein K2P19_06345 [Kineothrix sp.]|nr:hypothetical protein [Kineothrix sp.]
MKKIVEQWTKYVTPKVLARVLAVAYLLTLIPLLIIARYNFPSADDYSTGDMCRLAWINSHSVWEVLKQAVFMAWDNYFNWIGCFTSEVLVALHPGVFGERWYFLTTWIMLGMISCSTAYLLKNILVKVFKADKYMAWSVIMLVLFISVQCQGQAGRVEAYYWYCGAVCYAFSHGMSLFFYGILIKAVYDKGKKRVWDLAAASLLGFFVGGANQMSALNVTIVLAVAMGFMVCTKKAKKYKAFCIPAICFFLGFILSIAAPGNRVRASGTAGMGAVKSVMVSLYYGLDYVLGEWTEWPILLLIIILIPLFWHIAERTDFRFGYPVLVVLFGFGLVSAMITPPLFAVGNIEAGRLQALIFFMYILVLTLCVGYVTGWVRKQWEKGRGRQESTGRSFSKNTVLCLAGCAFFFVVASGICIIPEPHYYAFTSAITDLRNGNAKAYAEALSQRVELYNSDAEGILEVEPLPVQPALLYFSDITPYADSWENRALARYYQKEGVVVRTGD